jgi:hypothetical protein
MPEILLSLRLVNWRDYCAAAFVGLVLAICFFFCW